MHVRLWFIIFYEKARHICSTDCVCPKWIQRMMKPTSVIKRTKQICLSNVDVRDDGFKKGDAQMYLKSIFNDNLFFEINSSPSLWIVPAGSLAEVHDASLDSDTYKIQKTLQIEFEPLTNDGNIGVDCYKDVKNRINNIMSAK